MAHGRSTAAARKRACSCRDSCETLPDKLLAHIAPLGWEHISFNGDYVWPSEPLKQGFRSLRNPRSAFLDAA